MKLVLKNITKNINHKIILSDISISLSAGDIAIILGKSGVGKSTLLRIISGLDESYLGSVIINDKIQTKGSISKTIGLVFQDFQLWDNYTVIENITTPLQIVSKYSKKDAYEKGLRLLEEYELIENKNKKISQLSGGQKQRLAIARTIAMNVNIICFDEPFSALDPHLTRFIIEKIQYLQKQGYIILLTTHNVHILSKFQANIYFIENGKIEEEISTEMIHNNKNEKNKVFYFIHGQKNNE